MIGQWDPIHFQTPPAARYGMASANAINSGLYIFGGFGTQSSSQPYNPYTAYAAGQQDVNYNYATPPNFVQNPILMNNPDFVNNPNYNPMSGTGLNTKRDNDEDDGRIDHQYYPLQDAWFLNYMYEHRRYIAILTFVRNFSIHSGLKRGSKLKLHSILEVLDRRRLHRMVQDLRKLFIVWGNRVVGYIQP